MNINNQAPVTTNFKGIQNDIMKTFGKLDRKFRESLARNYNTLDNSDVVDLIYNDNKNIVLKTKKNLEKIIDGIENLPASTEIELTGLTRSKVDGSKLICSGTRIKNPAIPKDADLVIELGSNEIANEALKNFKFDIGGTYTDKLPTLGSLIDASYRISEPLEKIKKIMAETLYK